MRMRMRIRSLPSPQAGGPSLVIFTWLLIQCMHNYLSFIAGGHSSIHNSIMGHAVVTSDPPNMFTNTIITKNNSCKPNILCQYFAKAKLVGFEVFISVLTNTAIFWYIMLCSLNVHWCFGATHHLHLQGWKSAKQETNLDIFYLLIYYSAVPSFTSCERMLCCFLGEVLWVISEFC
jgi:hypothetical protein